MDTVRLETFSKTQTLISVTGEKYAALVREVFTPKFGDLGEQTHTVNGTTYIMFLVPASKSSINWTIIRAGITKKFTRVA